MAIVVGHQPWMVRHDETTKQNETKQNQTQGNDTQEMKGKRTETALALP